LDSPTEILATGAKHAFVYPPLDGHQFDQPWASVKVNEAEDLEQYFSEANYVVRVEGGRIGAAVAAIRFSIVGTRHVADEVGLPAVLVLQVAAISCLDLKSAISLVLSCLRVEGCGP
jgi:hypothetical protein